MANNKVQRNDTCPCGSGLKHKRCHGSQELANMATSAAKIIATMNIARRVLDADPATEAQYQEGTLQMIKVLNKMLPDGVKVVMEEVVEVEEVPDKLEVKKQSGQTLDDVQNDLVACPTCGIRLPADMSCAKQQCRVKVKGEQP